MSDKILNYCPYCGRKIPKFTKNKTNYCCFCGRKLINEKEKFTQKAQCTICHKMVDPNRHKPIRCSFCGSIYHSTCVSSWLLKYNACPMCQNVFLIPNKLLSLEK